MTQPIALQLYTVRDLLKEDFEGVIHRVAEIGYEGVETAGFPASTTPEKAARLFTRLGLEVTSAHTPLPLGDDKNRVLDAAAVLDCRRIISGHLPPEEYASIDKIKRACDRLSEANAVAVANGLEFGVHNHWWEFQTVKGQYPYQFWLEELDPAIFFELDLYWIQSAGLDPVEIIKAFGNRAPLLHVKDGPTPSDTSAPMTAVGDGVLDYPDFIEAALSSAEWLIVELDRCATDMMTAVEKSYRYLSEIAI
jgi:sugar phosphate isomerase/epimerase